MKEYAVTEIFYSLQGEGYYTGMPAVFIRFAACNLRCSFCDTDFSKATRMSAAAIIDTAVQRVQPTSFKEAHPLLVLTGGEPTLQADAELLALLHTKFPVIAMETNGSNPIPDGVDWITCSPKCDFVGEYPLIPFANEVKVVFDGRTETSPTKWPQRIVADYYYIQPCDTGFPDKNEEIVKKAVAYCQQHPRWRLSLQTQKILNVR